MGRHVNAEAGSDEGDAAPHEHARHALEPRSESEAESALLEPQAVISPDTHVGVDLDAPVTGAPPAAPSPANPDALIEHGLVGDGHELE